MPAMVSRRKELPVFKPGTVPVLSLLFVEIKFTLPNNIKIFCLGPTHLKLHNE